MNTMVRNILIVIVALAVYELFVKKLIADFSNR